MKRWSLLGAKVVGGVRPLDPKVPFAHARVVLRKQEEGEEYLLVYSYPAPEVAEGDSMTLSEWQALIAAGEAHQLEEPIPAAHDGTLWLLGRDFPGTDRAVEELRAANALITASHDSRVPVLVCFINESRANEVRKHLANKAFDQALQLTQIREWTQALSYAERAFDLGGMSGERAEERVALLSLLYKFLGRKRRSNGYLEMALNSRGQQFYEKTLEKYRDLSTKIAPIRGRPAIATLIIFLALGMLAVLAVLGAWTIPSTSDFPFPKEKEAHDKLIATILVYFMQFGFIAFEAGAVRQNYRRHSAVKNLVVFAISFISYIFLGWRIQQYMNNNAFSNLLDIAFNAGFASTVSLIVANTITERGTLLVNVLCTIVAAGFAYPCLAGLAFDEGPFARDWIFVDTAGGCVVHVLGGMFALAAALWIGPRSRRRAWYLLGKVQMAEQRDYIPFNVIGAFFLWFGWLGFNSGNAKTWDAYVVAFTNTNIGASAGGLVGLVVGVASMAMLTTTSSSDLSRGSVLREILREIANLERVVLGMMGGLVAVTANASLVKPWQALVEAMIGAGVAVVGSAVIVHYKERLDDPLGAIATHGFAGTVGVLCTAVFRPDRCSIGTQALGCILAAVIGWSLASIACVFLWGIERLRKSSEWWLYGKMWRLTSYEQQTGRTGTEFSVPAEDIERARRRIRAGQPVLQRGGDKSWIDAVAVLALSEKPDEELKELFTALDTLLGANYQGSLEEQTALAAIKARADVTKLLMCVNRTLAHRALERPPGVLEWRELDPLYTETLIVTISELAESFAADYRTLRVVKSPTELREMVEGFVKACNLLKEIGEEQEVDEEMRAPTLVHNRAQVRLRAWKNFLYLKKLPWYKEIIEMHKMISA